MSNGFALALAVALIAVIIGDRLLADGWLTVFIGRRFLELMRALTFWR